MSPKARALIGLMTTLAFVGCGLLAVYLDKTLGGGVLVAMGLYRGLVTFRQFQYAFGEDEDED